MALYIGLISGTSADGINAVLADFDAATTPLLATHYIPYPADLRRRIKQLYQKGHNEIEQLGELEGILGKAFAEAAKSVLAKTHYLPAQIKAIGCHGQTIRHAPNATVPFTIQLGNPSVIAAETGIPTIAAFRHKDMALGGQGAPLVPAFHHHYFQSTTQSRAMVNIGGIANVTILPALSSAPIIAFDTGPGNTLLDAWIAKHQAVLHDEKGAWARSGCVAPTLLKRLLQDPYFSLPPPKSTGFEYFNLTWLARYLQNEPLLSPESVQATLVLLTAHSIIQAIQSHVTTGEIIVCGGGAYNIFLMETVHHLATPAFTVATTADYGIAPEWVEALAFAWLAKQTDQRLPGNVPSVTGAKKAAILGGIYY